MNESAIAVWQTTPILVASYNHHWLFLMGPWIGLSCWSELYSAGPAHASGVNWLSLSSRLVSDGLSISRVSPYPFMKAAWHVLMMVAGVQEQKWKHASEFPSLCLHQNTTLAFARANHVDGSRPSIGRSWWRTRVQGTWQLEPLAQSSTVYVITVMKCHYVRLDFRSDKWGLASWRSG